jgi:hypothetical protein
MLRWSSESGLLSRIIISGNYRSSSSDGRSVKYENVCLHAYRDGREARAQLNHGIRKNTTRPARHPTRHQNLRWPR